MFEINLVPDVKAEMINAQKKRNVVLFASVAISAVAAAIVVILLGVKLGQDIKLNSQDSRLEAMSDTIDRYDGLSNLLTVQKQLTDLQTISENKTMLSRVFGVLSSIVQQKNGDQIRISQLDVNMDTAELTFDGQAEAGPTTDGMNYRVLESFTKSVALMSYDYGRYVDKNGKEIPVACIFESGPDGIPFAKVDTATNSKNIYAIWAKGVEGCDPSSTGNDSGVYDDVDEPNSNSNSNSNSNTNSNTNSNSNSGVVKNTKMTLQDVDLSKEPDDVNTVRIWRTPQFTEWYTKTYMKLDGTIEKTPHFESKCITYSGTESGKTVNWTSTIDPACSMASPSGIEVTNSTDGKQTGGKLVLMFSAVLHLNPEVLSFSKKHVITIMPAGYQNVTDSFIQVGDMFAERAKIIGPND